MNVSTDRVFHILAALKELQREIQECRRAIDAMSESSDEGVIRFVLDTGEEEEDVTNEEDSSSDDTVASAPATVSYERDDD